MLHHPISLQNISLSFSAKDCFENFSQQIHYGNKIAIIGKNGSGKSSLLSIIEGALTPSAGTIELPQNLVLAKVEQHTTQQTSLSGGEQFEKDLSLAISKCPNCLLLDEPTNHLDRKNRSSLISYICNSPMTIIMASHDEELITSCAEQIWHIENNQIHVFNGSYIEYQMLLQQQQRHLLQQKKNIISQQKSLHKSRMKEQERAAKSKKKGQKKYQGDKLSLQAAKRRGQSTSAKINSTHMQQIHELHEQQSNIPLHEQIEYKFTLPESLKKSGHVIAIRDGVIGYHDAILRDINLDLYAGERIAICGDNGSGKTTLLQALFKGSDLQQSGTWSVPCQSKIGYVDQFYSNLEDGLSVLENMLNFAPKMNLHLARKHLSRFFFRSDSEINKQTCYLSGGERARLSLAVLAYEPRDLLILDEMTNNIDLETKKYIIQVLQQYPGAMVVVSHDEDFVEQMNIDASYHILNSSIVMF